MFRQSSLYSLILVVALALPVAAVELELPSEEHEIIDAAYVDNSLRVLFSASSSSIYAFDADASLVRQVASLDFDANRMIVRGEQILVAGGNDDFKLILVEDDGSQETLVETSLDRINFLEADDDYIFYGYQVANSITSFLKTFPSNSSLEELFSSHIEFDNWLFADDKLYASISASNANRSKSKPQILYSSTADFADMLGSFQARYKRQYISSMILSSNKDAVYFIASENKDFQKKRSVLFVNDPESGFAKLLSFKPNLSFLFLIAANEEKLLYAANQKIYAYDFATTRTTLVSNLKPKSKKERIIFEKIVCNESLNECLLHYELQRLQKRTWFPVSDTWDLIAI